MFENKNDNYSLNLESGWICLDYANTAIWHGSEIPEEHINNFNDLYSWAREIGLIKGQQAKDMLQLAKKNPAGAKKIHKKAITLRETIYHIFSAVAAGKQPETSDLSILNDVLSRALCHLAIVSSDKDFSWEWIPVKYDLDQILWPVARSSADLLTSKEIDRVGECADDRGCGWLFLDTSRNRSRRWCDMKDCGNRDKVRRYYERKKTQ